VQLAADNTDIIEETLDGKNTTHATSHGCLSEIIWDTGVLHAWQKATC